MIRSNLYERMNIAGNVNVELNESEQYYIFLNLDLLNGCEFSCDGCFVNKGINSHDLERDLQTVAAIADQINESHYHLEEIALGPTDFFSSKNIRDILKSPDFKRLFKNPQTKFVMTSTLKVGVDSMKEKLKLLEESIGHLDIDLLIAIDMDEFLNTPGFIESLKERWSILEESSLEFDPAFQINIHPSELIKSDPQNLTRLAELIKHEFNTILEFNPSILRVKHRKLNENLGFWMNTMRENQKSDPQKFTYTMLNKSHNGMNSLVLNFKNNDFYICPFIYENVFSYEEAFKISKKGSEYSLDDLIGEKEEYLVKQFNYSTQTKHCGDCEYLISCSYKNVLTFMEANKISQCFLGLGNGASSGRTA